MNHSLEYRPEIDGLRAIAVLSVIGFHLFGIKGGFVGVDIFFVISGYLITKILISEINSGNFSFIGFYARRARRIFPSLIVVLFSCFVIGWGTLLSSEFKLLGKHIFSGAIFSSNIVLWFESGYFDRVSDLKPLLHLWSLGVEEQFYIFWPLLLVFGFRWRWPIILFIAILTGASFFGNLYISSVNSTFAFYWLPTRMWELLSGALLAQLTNTNAGNSSIYKYISHQLIGQLLSTLGLFLIVLSLIYVESRNPYPSYWALIPVMGTMLILLGGKESWINQHLLSNSLMRNIGLISYPLYLWHWPLISFSKIMNNGLLDRTHKLICFLLTFLLAYITYQFIEKKLRYLKGYKGPLYLSVSLLCIGFIGLGVFWGDGINTRYPHQEKIYRQSISIDEKIVSFDSKQGCQRHFKALDFSGECWVADKTKPPTILIVGDSHAISYYPGLAYQYHLHGENLQLIARGACVPLLGIETHRNGLPDVCADIMSEIYEYAVSQKSIKKVLIAFRGPWYLHGGGSSYLKRDPNPIFLQGLNLEQSIINTHDYLSSAKKQIVLFLDNPELGFHPKECFDIRPVRLRAGGVRENCFVTESEAMSIAKNYRAKISNIYNHIPNMKIFDTFDYFCRDGACPAIKDGKLLYDDDNHLSLNGAHILAQQFMLMDSKRFVPN